MTFLGHVENATIVIHENPVLPEGALVRVEFVEKRANEPGKEYPTLYEQLKPIIGMAKGLPPDLAENHDHYLHGQLRR